MKLSLKSKIKQAFIDLDTILENEHFGTVSKKYIDIVNDTREAIKNYEMTYGNRTVENALEIDIEFDKYIVRKS